MVVVTKPSAVPSPPAPAFLMWIVFSVSFLRKSYIAIRPVVRAAICTELNTRDIRTNLHRQRRR